MAYAMNSAELFSSGTRNPDQTYVKKEDKPFIFLSAIPKHLIGNNLMEEGFILLMVWKDSSSHLDCDSRTMRLLAHN